jgi:hypothetical protein
MMEQDRERMTLIADLEAFVHDHRPHGQMTGDATEPASNGYRLTVACVRRGVRSVGHAGGGRR